MQFIKGDLSNIKGILPSGLCVGVHRDGAINTHVHKIEKVDDLRLDWLRGMEKVGIIGANETAEWMINDAIERIRSMAA